MNTFLQKHSKSLRMVIGVLSLAVFSTAANAKVDGLTGVARAPVFNLTASDAYITTPDGDNVLMWGYGPSAGVMQYPGPTLIVNQGDVVTINLTSELNVFNPLGVKTSMIFPGQNNVVATGGTPGLITNETSGPLETVSYTFTASKAGTFMYQSGTNQRIQLEMGLVGTIVVRPNVPAAIPAVTQAYGLADTAFDYEYLFVLTEMDPKVHYAVEFANTYADIEAIDNTENHSVLWFINGRNGPDTVAPSFAPYFPHQPYGSIAQVHPGDIALIRFVNAGRDLHPFHTHGNHFKILARDGELLTSSPTATLVDLARDDFTLQAVPGATYDVLWGWTGEKMGWDILGAATTQACDDPDGDGIDNTTQLACVSCIDVNPVDGFADTLDGTQGQLCHDNCANPTVCPDLVAPFGFNDNTGAACYDQFTREYCPDHTKDVPITLTNQAETTFGGYFGGSPFLGAFAALPPGEGGLNLNGGMFYMWHSHNEREIVNNDIYPGGMLTMMIVEPIGVVIEK